MGRVPIPSRFVAERVTSFGALRPSGNAFRVVGYVGASSPPKRMAGRRRGNHDMLAPPCSLLSAARDATSMVQLEDFIAATRISGRSRSAAKPHHCLLCASFST